MSLLDRPADATDPERPAGPARPAADSDDPALAPGPLPAARAPEAADDDEPAARGRVELRPWRWRLRTRVLAVAGALVALLLVNTVVEVAGAGDDGSGLPPGARDAAVQRLLDVRARAVLTHDEAAWMSVVGTDDASFVERQRAQFRGLDRLPFQTFAYRALPGRSYTVPGTTRRWGPTATVAAVVATHRLRGYDEGDVAEAVALTIARVDGGWRLLSDTDADAFLPPGGHSAPWDLGEVQVATGRHSLVVGDAGDDEALPALARRADQAVEAVERVWPAGPSTWPGRVVVYAAHDSQTMERMLRGTDLGGAQPLAIAYPVLDGFTWFDTPTLAPAEVGSRIAVDAAGADVDPSTLRHEITHVATQRQQLPGTPTWMVEGIAEYTALRPSSVQTLLEDEDVPDPELYESIGEGDFALHLPASVSFYTGDQGTVVGHYSDALIACTYVRERWGEATLLRLHAELSKSVDALDEPAVQSRVLRDVLGVTPQRFQEDAGRALDDALFG
ncbi:hypothetical protein [Angustibacter aerolatus]